MNWKSSCSIGSDDDSSRHSFLSDCDSEFDLRPPPRYPAEKRSSSILTKQSSMNRTEPPLTRSRAKAIGKIIPASAALPKERRQTTTRRSVDSINGLTTAFKSGLNQNSFLFSKQEPTNDNKASNLSFDGVNFLADRFENCSLDEEKINKKCAWPSSETNSRYIRPIVSPQPTHTFGANPFSMLNNFNSSSAPPLFGQHQTQLWSRFRSAASALRNDINIEQSPSATFDSPFTRTNPLLFRSNPDPLSTVRQRKITTINNPIPPSSARTAPLSPRSSSKLAFTLTIFLIGVVLGYILTSTLPPGQLWKSFLHCYYLIQVLLEYFVNFFQR